MLLSQFLNMVADACFIIITPIAIYALLIFMVWMRNNWDIKQ